MASYMVFKDELFPVWSIEDQGIIGAGMVDLTDEEVARIKAANEEWEGCQDLIESKLVREE
jgi:hypothetical protein